ncbi:morc family cw-type zinc finger protein 4 [Phtheirospermum japonicum]|uniref:Morc family cw-type zinc finger protein 4 n=1 Tax=Phtheirospermum japonicum TaxID=374723 RepID=A0A830CZ59_9LAMI|nr:morc family cw-type zinc finger protein 4 [Phtheirospermum japonicum]
MGPFLCSPYAVKIIWPAVWEVSSIVRKEKIEFLSELPGFLLNPACEDLHQEREWRVFLGFLRKNKRVAIAKLGLCEVYILPPDEDLKSGIATALYKGKIPIMSPSTRCHALEIAIPEILSPPRFQAGEAALSNSDVIEDRISPAQRYPEVNGDYSCDLKAKDSSRLGTPAGPIKFFERNYVVAHPSYLKTLGQAHSGWIFGAIAELVDNSRDAKATKLEVAINMVYSKTDDKDIPMLSLIDDGHGMSHEDVLRMISFGHAQPEAEEPNRIGRYGVGFKTGAMRLGKDALVLTQTANSRSIAFLSQSLNEGKNNLEIPIVSYRRVGQFMEVDTNVQNEDSAKYNLKIIKKFSPFDKYLIDEWGQSYSLQWDVGMTGASSYHQGGIFIRSRRIRSRPGQMSQMVPLDFSLKSYLEVIFLDPRMKIYVQGALVKSRPLAKSLNKTVVQTGVVLGKQLKLTLGRSQLEWEQANCDHDEICATDLYGAYKRVGSMIHNGDCGRGIIGVIDVTCLMDDNNGHVWVHSNKQGFQDCEAYAELEKWLGEKVDEYLDSNVDKIQVKKGNSLCKPDHEWVQCDKCRKWRMLIGEFDIKKLPMEWFCYMKPFNGRCDMPEEDVSGLITISTQRHGNNSKGPTESKNRPPENATSGTEGVGDDEIYSESSDDNAPLSFKRNRTSLPRGWGGGSNTISLKLTDVQDITYSRTDTINTVYYAWAMQQLNPEELGEGAPYSIWKLREMQQQGIRALI